jgi:hypothetical protein
MSKLKKEDIIEIRRIKKAMPFLTHRTISGFFGITGSAVSNIVNRVSWKHI